MANAHDLRPPQAMKIAKLSLFIFNNIQLSKIEPVTGASWEAFSKQRTEALGWLVPGDTAMAFSSVSAGRRRIKTLLSFGCQGGSQTRWVLHLEHPAAYLEM
jgi:hypothetical protein